MRIIELKEPSLNKDWSSQFMDSKHYDTLLDENVAVFKPDGQPLLILLKNALDPQKVANAWRVLKKFNSKTGNRAIATGIEAEPKKKLDGTLSGVREVPKSWKVISGLLGSFERNIRMPYAHHCNWNRENPKAFEAVFPMLEQCSSLFKYHVPERYAVQKSYVDRTHPEWVIPNTVYTTLTVNKNFRTAAHQDVGDLATGFSNMLVIRDGLFSGGNLVLPNWRIAAKLDNCDFIMFDAHEFHGNTQIVPLSKGATRCSIVCYYREKMALCKGPEEELLQAKNRKPGQSIFEEQI